MSGAYTRKDKKRGFLSSGSCVIMLEMGKDDTYYTRTHGDIECLDCLVLETRLESGSLVCEEDK
jgi:hypothetical protein